MSCRRQLVLTRGQHRASRYGYICVFIFSAESFTDIIIFYLLVCLSVRLLFSLSCAGSFCFLHLFFFILLMFVMWRFAFSHGYVGVDPPFLLVHLFFVVRPCISMYVLSCICCWWCCPIAFDYIYR